MLTCRGQRLEAGGCFVQGGLQAVGGSQGPPGAHGARRPRGQISPVGRGRQASSGAIGGGAPDAGGLFCADESWTRGLWPACVLGRAAGCPSGTASPAVVGVTASGGAPARAPADGTPGQAGACFCSVSPAGAGVRPPGVGRSALHGMQGSLRLNWLLLHCNALPLV